MKKSNVLILFILFASLWINCATATAGMATSNIPIVNKKYKVVGPVEARIKWYTFDIAFIGFPLREPPIDDVIKSAIDQKNADALINIKYWNDKIIALFITVNRFGLTAEAIKFEDTNISPPADIKEVKKK